MEAERAQPSDFSTPIYNRPAWSRRTPTPSQVVDGALRRSVADPACCPPTTGADSTEGLARTVADYIAGMTDSFILLQYPQVKRAVRR